MNLPVVERSTRNDADDLAAADLLNLIKQCLDALHHDGVARVDLQTLAHGSDQHSDVMCVLQTLQHEYAAYQRNERVLQEAGEHFARVYEQHKERLSHFQTMLRRLSQELNHTPLPNIPFATELPPRSPQRPPTGPSPFTTSPDVIDSSGDELPPLYITCFGTFEIWRGNQPIELCPNRNGQSVLRYLLAQDDYTASAEQLLDMMWPDDDPKVARNKLYIAISALRRSLQADLPQSGRSGYVMCKNHTYALNAELMHTDAEQFTTYYQLAQKEPDPVGLYEQACALYKGPYLQDDVYADWSFLAREDFNYKYVVMCKSLSANAIATGAYDDAARWAMQALQIDQCDEGAHRLLMQVYVSQGHRSKAIQQYNQCETILSRELGVEPLPDTVDFYRTVVQRV